jgi:hypothetical protein
LIVAVLAGAAVKVVIMRNVVLAAVIGVLVVAGSRWLRRWPEPISISNITRDAGAQSRCALDRTRSHPTKNATQQKAEDAAVLWCDVTGKANDCQVVISGLGCLSLAESSDGKTLVGRQAFVQDAADAAALAGAGSGSKSDLNGCSG